MKILMRNIGMTLHVIHKLRERGMTNVQVNMDWQHLIMNGESLGEYAAMLAAEGLLGHQHANSGWGTFDDDNMVGATAFMETLELARRAPPRALRRERRAPRVRPLPVHRGRGRRGRAERPPVALHLGRLGPDRRAGAPRGAVAQGRRPRLRARLRRPRRRVVDATAGGPLRPRRLRSCDEVRDAAGGRLGRPGGQVAVSRARARRRGLVGNHGFPTLVGLDVGTTGVKALALSPEGEVLAVASRGYRLSTPQPGWAEQDPEAWVAAAESALREVADGRDVAGIGLSGQMHGLVVLDGAGRVIRPAILWNDQRTGAECREIEERVGLDRLIALTGNRALTGFTAPKLLWLRRHEPDAYARISRVLLPKDYVRLRLTGEWAIDASDASGTLLLDVERRAWSDGGARGARAAVDVAPARARVARPRRRRAGRPAAGHAGRSRRGRPAGRRDRGRRRPARRALGRARDVRRRPRRAARLRPRPRGPRPCVLPRRAGHLAGDGRDAVGRRLARVAPHDARRRRPGRPAGRRGGGVGRPAPRGSSSSRTSRASARRTRTRTRAARSSASSCGTTAGRSSVPSSRASRSACATRST